MRQGSRPRRGVVLVMALAVMAVLSIILSVVTVQIVAQRQTLRQRQRHLQATWLARAGVELAAARLLESPTGFSDATQELVPYAKLHIVVEKSAAELFQVKVEATVGLDEGPPVAKSASASFRRTDDGSGVRLRAEPSSSNP